MVIFYLSHILLNSKEEIAPYSVDVGWGGV
jgi:hypothetical protein